MHAHIKKDSAKKAAAQSQNDGLMVQDTDIDAVIVDARVALYGSNKVSKHGKEFFHDMQD